jgi:hypothetical protein
MYDLIAIVKATRASASALRTRSRLFRLFDQEKRKDKPSAETLERLGVQIKAAGKRYDRAQAVLAANPLPGDTN